MNDRQAAANMLEQRNKQRNSLRLIMTDTCESIVRFFAKSFSKSVSRRYNENSVA